MARVHKEWNEGKPAEAWAFFVCYGRNFARKMGEGHGIMGGDVFMGGSMEVGRLLAAPGKGISSALAV